MQADRQSAVITCDLLRADAVEKVRGMISIRAPYARIAPRADIPPARRPGSLGFEGPYFVRHISRVRRPAKIVNNSCPYSKLRMPEKFQDFFGFRSFE